jgi:hypothetical protein
MLSQEFIYQKKMIRGAVKTFTVVLAAILICVFASFCAVIYDQEEKALKKRADLVHSKYERDIEAILGAPIKISERFISIHPSHSSGIFTEKDEEQGYVFKLYNYWVPSTPFHGSYKTLAVKIRPSDGTILAAKIVVE